MDLIDFVVYFSIIVCIVFNIFIIFEFRKIKYLSIVLIVLFISTIYLIYLHHPYMTTLQKFLFTYHVLSYAFNIYYCINPSKSFLRKISAAISLFISSLFLISYIINGHDHRNLNLGTVLE